MPIGGEPQAVDVRIISATHRDLLERVSEGSFREDLYYRLNGLEVALPALRERSDKAQLLDFLLRQEASGEAIDLAPSARQALLEFAWPGNVRQMRNVLRTLVALCEDNRIEFSDLPAIVKAGNVKSTIVKLPLEPSSLESMPDSSQPTPPRHQPAPDSFLNSATPMAILPPAARTGPAPKTPPTTSAKPRTHCFIFLLLDTAD